MPGGTCGMLLVLINRSIISITSSQRQYPDLRLGGTLESHGDYIVRRLLPSEGDFPHDLPTREGHESGQNLSPRHPIHRLTRAMRVSSLVSSATLPIRGVAYPEI